VYASYIPNKAQQRLTENPSSAQTPSAAPPEQPVPRGGIANADAAAKPRTRPNNRGTARFAVLFI
jgi:hypothetical protein